jgi:hypothetical protein
MIPDPERLRLEVKEDGIWLVAFGADGSGALTNLSMVLPRGRPGFIDKTLHGVMDDLILDYRDRDQDAG